MVCLLGLHDDQLILRSLLKNYMNGDSAYQLKQRYMANRNSMDSLLNIEVDKRILESVSTIIIVIT